jgi:hypothetical protein
MSKKLNEPIVDLPENLRVYLESILWIIENDMKEPERIEPSDTD